MDATKSSLLAVFEKKMRLEVPLFQRQYVWDQERQWEPLWEDIERKFSESLAGRKDGPVHFLGALVLDQKQTPTTHVERRQVIDGQQRLTTLQIFLAAFRDFCAANGCDELAKECEGFTINKGMMADPETECFKVWPTQSDRDQFIDVIQSGSRKELERRHPITRQKYARRPDPRPRMVDAYLYFYDQLTEFFLGAPGEPPLAPDIELTTRLDECFQTLRNALMVVIIDLQASDDPQVIFETLNARGEPLLPADLLRNYIFLRAARADAGNAEDLYKKYWSPFDEPFWREEVQQGRLNRPRSDLYMQHFLASRQGQDIPIKHLYVEYRHWIERTRPFDSVIDELATLSRQGVDFRRILEPSAQDRIYPVVSFLEAYDIRTAYPLLLFLLDQQISPDQWREVAQSIESYLLRRAVCDLSTKNYNKVFLTLAKNLRSQKFSSAKLVGLLLGQSGDSAEWPDNQRFIDAWMTKPLGSQMNNSRLVFILSRLNGTFMSAKAEQIEFSEQPTIEHIMPQTWIEHWPLPDGSRGLDWRGRFDVADDDPRAVASKARDAAVQTMGNLTILSHSLNAAQQNSHWTVKRPEMARHSLLPINQPLSELPDWSEDAIRTRGSRLFERALQIWKRPSSANSIP